MSGLAGLDGAERLRRAALGLNYEPVPSGGEGAQIAEIKAAAESKTPLLIWFWLPHWITTEVPLEWATMPAYDPACVDDPSWGLNPDKTWDCGVESPGTIKLAW